MRSVLSMLRDLYAAIEQQDDGADSSADGKQERVVEAAPDAELESGDSDAEHESGEEAALDSDAEHKSGEEAASDSERPRKRAK